MIDEILINVGLTETRIALLDAGRLVELGLARDGNDTMVGDVYLARAPGRARPGARRQRHHGRRRLPGTRRQGGAGLEGGVVRLGAAPAGLPGRGRRRGA